MNSAKFQMNTAIAVVIKSVKGPFCAAYRMPVSVNLSSCSLYMHLNNYPVASEQELHLGLCFLPVCHCDPICSYLLQCGMWVDLYSFIYSFIL